MSPNTCVMLVLTLLLVIASAMTVVNGARDCTKVRLKLGAPCTWVAASDGAHPKPPCDYVIKPYHECPYGRRAKGLGIPKVCRHQHGCGCEQGLVCRGPRVDVCSGGRGVCVAVMNEVEP